MTHSQDEPQANNQVPSDSETQIPLAELIRTRLTKVRQLREEGINAYPYRYTRTHDIAELREKFEQFAADATKVRVAGRIMLKRKMGKSTFADIRDGSERIQVYAKLNNVGEEAYADRKSVV